MFVLLNFWDEVSFSPTVFLNDYLKFIGTILVLFLSFVLIQIFWENKKTRYTQEIALVNISRALSNFSSLNGTILTAINNISASQDLNEMKVFAELKSNYFSKINLLKSTILNNTTPEKHIEPELISFICMNLFPLFDKLSGLVDSSFFELKDNITKCDADLKDIMTNYYRNY